MKSLNKVLVGLLLIGISINLDLNAAKKRPYAKSLEYELRADSRSRSRSRKILKTSEEQDVSDAIIAQDESSDEEGDLGVPILDLVQDEEESDRIGLRDFLEFEPAVKAMAKQPGLVHRFRLPREFDISNLAQYLPDRAANGALVVFSAGDLMATYLPVGLVSSFALNVSTLASVYLVYKGGERLGEWVLNHSEVVNQFHEQVKTVTKKAKRTVRERCTIQ